MQQEYERGYHQSQSSQFSSSSSSEQYAPGASYFREHPHSDFGLEGELESDEQLLWFARPKSGARGKPFSSLLTISTFLFATGFMFFIMGAFIMIINVIVVLQDHTVSPSTAALIAVGASLTLTAVLCGILSFALRPSLDRTIYGITERRIIIIHDKKERVVESYYVVNLDTIKRSEHRDGTGNITCIYWADKKKKDAEKGRREVELIGIADPYAVEQVIRRTFLNK